MSDVWTGRVDHCSRGKRNWRMRYRLNPDYDYAISMLERGAQTELAGWPDTYRTIGCVEASLAAYSYCGVRASDRQFRVKLNRCRVTESSSMRAAGRLICPPMGRLNYGRTISGQSQGSIRRFVHPCDPRFRM